MRAVLFVVLAATTPAAGAGDAAEGRWTDAAATEASGIPYFARKYGVRCAQCHVVPPKLNEFGRAFLARGYAMPGMEAAGTWPVAVWASGRVDDLRTGDADRLVTYLNRLELVSGGELVAPWLSFFVEWRALSRETRADGSTRDRSGRFEDLFLVAQADRLEVMVGQFRQVRQVDVSQRLSLSEPLVLSTGLPGRPGETGRQTSLRGFSPAMRSPSVRLAWNQPVADGWTWTNAVAVPVPGEFSLPLTREARREASNEIEWRPKGVFLESYARSGVSTVGAHAFYDGGMGRFLANALTTGAAGPFHWTGMAGLDRTGSGGPVRGRWSVEGEYFPSNFTAIGVRLEDRAGDGLQRALLPHVTAHFPGTTYTVRMTLEQRIQRGRNATLIEIGTVF